MLSVLTAVLPVMGLLPGRVMDGLAAMGRGFLAGHAPAHAVEYFAWVNLKGALISLAIGGAVYLLLVRPLLSQKTPEGRLYPDRWPQWLNLETGLYRPLVCRWLPLAGAVIARAGESLVDGTTALLGDLLYRGQTRDVRPGQDGHFAAYQPKPRPRVGFRYSFAYSLLLMGLGMSAALLYVLVLG